jgi:RNA polymerase sigma-70 factor, ECF subfamily
MKEVAAGDPEACAKIYDDFSAVLYGEVRSVLGFTPEAEDLVHDVFLKLFKNAGRFKGDRTVALSWARMLARSGCLALSTSPGSVDRERMSPTD